MTKTRVIKRFPILSLPEHNLADVMALKAVSAGTATPDQQRRAILWIMQKACMIGGVSFNPDNKHATNFSEGRRFVGITINEFISEPIDTLRKRFSKEEQN